MPVQIGRDTIEEAKSQIVLRLRIVIDAAIVAAAGPLHGEARGSRILSRDLARGHAGIGHAHGLVMEIPEHVALRFQQATTRSLPQVGQWCDAKTTCMSPPNMSSACCRYFDHSKPSRTFAPRSV